MSNAIDCEAGFLNKGANDKDKKEDHRTHYSQIEDLQQS